MTLKQYYPLAGEMVTNAAGDPELLCNNRGVDFVEASADVELRELDLYRPDESIVGKLVPAKKTGVLAAQATQLKCGGVVVGCTFDHRIADGYSANMFWKSWTELAQSKPLSDLPSFRRSLLSPRRPGSFNPSVTEMFTTVPKLPRPQKESDDLVSPPLTVSRVYSVSSEQLCRLQELANDGNPNSLISKGTKLDALIAYLWKLVAGAANADRKYSRLGMVVDGRPRLGHEMSGYFGNVLSFPFGEKENGELKTQPLNSVVNDIHKFLHPAVTKDHFQGLVDFVEAHRDLQTLPRIYASEISRESPGLVVSSGKDFRVGNIDFGWGVPVFGSYQIENPTQSGFVLPMPSQSGNGDWIVYMNLPKYHIEAIEKAASHVFKPLHLDF